MCISQLEIAPCFLNINNLKRILVSSNSVGLIQPDIYTHTHILSYTFFIIHNIHLLYINTSKTFIIHLQHWDYWSLQWICIVSLCDYVILCCDRLILWQVLTMEGISTCFTNEPIEGLIATQYLDRSILFEVLIAT